MAIRVGSAERLRRLALGLLLTTALAAPAQAIRSGHPIKLMPAPSPAARELLPATLAMTVPDRAALAPPMPRPSQAAPATQNAEAPWLLSIALGLEPVSEVSQLAVVWSQPVPMAAYAVGDSLFIQFAAAPRSAPVLPLVDPHGRITGAEVVDGAEGLLLRLRTARPEEVRISREAGIWLFRFGDEAAAKPAAGGPGAAGTRLLARQLAGGALELTLAGEPLRAVELPDAVFGGRAVALLSTDVRPVIGQPVRLNGVEILPALQGAVVRPLTEGWSLAGASGTVLLERQSDLASPPAPPSPAAVPAEAPLRALEAAREVAGPPRQLVPEHRERAPGLLSPELTRERTVGLLRIAEAGPPRPEGENTTERARRLLAEGRAAEAREALAGSGTPEDDSEGTLLRAAAEWLVSRDPGTAAVFARPDLEHDPELVLWRAVALPDRPVSLTELDRAASVLARYPTALQVRLGPLLAERALAEGALQINRQTTNLLRATHPGEPLRSQLDLLEARGAMQRSDFRLARQLFDRAAGAGDLATAVEGRAGRTLAEHFAGLTGAAEAAAALEAQRTLWRSHPAEARLLLHLAALEIDAGEPVKAVEVWQDLVAGAGEAGLPAPQEDSLRRQLIRALEGDDDAALTLAALALTREFPRLVEQGGDGPLLRARLDQRLAESAFGGGVSTSPPAPTSAPATVTVADAPASTQDASPAGSEGTPSGFPFAGVTPSGDTGTAAATIEAPPVEPTPAAPALPESDAAAGLRAATSLARAGDPKAAARALEAIGVEDAEVEALVGALATPPLEPAPAAGLAPALEKRLEAARTLLDWSREAAADAPATP